MKLIGVIDAGTNKIRFVIYQTPSFEELCSHELRIKQISPKQGWLEHDPQEIISAVRECAKVAMHLLPNHGFSKSDIASIGITNQRETIVMWNKKTGDPLHNAIVWKDTRTMTSVDEILQKLNVDKDHFRELSGLPVSSIPSALKIRWLKKFVPSVRDACRDGLCLAGTIDSWIVWNLIRGLHVTDCTNASRTLLMNLSTLMWDSQLTKAFKIDDTILPEIKSSSEIYGRINDGSELDGLVISSIIGNQQASLLGQQCFKIGQAKSTYRSGCFLLCNVGSKPVYSSHGLVTTVGYKFGKEPPVYALEGNIAIGGAALKWLKDNLGLLSDAAESESLANMVPTTGDCYFVPAFRGLFAPYYQQEARGVICGLTAFTTKNHIIRAALETVCYQITDIIEAMKKDAGFHLAKLHCDGKMAQNGLLMQLQADIIRSQTNDTTSFGCAIAAARAEGIDLIDFTPQNRVYNVKVHHDTYLPTLTDEDRKGRNKKWKMAVERSYGWATSIKSAEMTNERYAMLASIPFTMFMLSSFGLLSLSKALE
ncbi:CLUMA_CG006499, isoform A [Clunio marinus]|uniref:glycerol kinase n=1 Tax=Clunio marinus TaxID=568069 RepID=A0A1J1HXZ5_9DIPT|nr:CLUMA_CG006499, isoform A [Clunio marinus]